MTDTQEPAARETAFYNWAELHRLIDMVDQITEFSAGSAVVLGKGGNKRIVTFEELGLSAREAAACFISVWRRALHDQELEVLTGLRDAHGATAEDFRDALVQYDLSIAERPVA